MGENSKIEWTDMTFNPWLGCQKVSDGCRWCYAETLMDHRYGRVKWGPQGTRQRTSDANWRRPLQWNRQAEREGRRFRVFCASLADVFEDKPELVGWRRDLLQLIEQTRNLDWLLLTKRPENISRMIVQATGRDEVAWLADCRHVWAGTSVEDQSAADERIPHLLRVPARVRFLSCEPLLGPIDLWGARYQNPNGGLTGAVTSWPGGVQWVITGGESGHHARPMHPQWARAIRDECQAAGVPFLFKQHGEYMPEPADWYGDREYVCAVCGRHSHAPRGHCDHDWRQQASMVKVGKKDAGRLLDGREWNEFPSPEAVR